MLSYYQLSTRTFINVHVLVPILLFLTVVVALLVTMKETISALPPDVAEGSQSSHPPIRSLVNVHYTYSSPPDYFLPSRHATDPRTFDPTTTNFGLITREYDSDTTLSHGDHYRHLTDWQRFEHHLDSLNSNADSNTTHHVLFLARHGQGYHNLAESYYGAAAWDCHFAELDGDPDSNISWSDAHLSKLGQQQAREQSEFWTKQIREAKMPAPRSWFVSPMNRACKTCEITFTPLSQSGILGQWKPTVKEYLRETNGIHTCDQRSSKSVIQSNFPEYQIEDGFEERDLLWDAVYRETEEAHTYRAQCVLDDIVHSTAGSGQFLSITAHGGMINAILRAIGHREFTVRVGSAIAVFVKAERHDGKRAGKEFGTGATKPQCASDPLKAGLPGFRSLEEYVKLVEAEVQV